MANDTQYEVFQHYGTNAQRLAFTPTPAGGIQPIYSWWVTDAGANHGLWIYDTGWSQVGGGTGSLPATVQGDILYASGTNTLSALAKDTNATRYLSNTGTTNNPAWAQVALATGVSGDLPYSNLAQGTALSVLGVTGNATADNASIVAANDHEVLRRSGTAVAFGAIDLTSSAAVSGTLPVANGGTGVSSLFAPMLKKEVSIVNADVKKLPSVPYEIVPSPGAGFRIKLHSWTISTNFDALAYSGINTTYATLQLQDAGGDWISSPVVNDNSASLTQVTTMFGATNRTYDLAAVPMFPASGWISFIETTDTPNVDNSALNLAMDNNSSPTDLGGGDASNVMVVRAYYSIESTAT